MESYSYISPALPSALWQKCMQRCVVPMQRCVAKKRLMALHRGEFEAVGYKALS